MKIADKEALRQLKIAKSFELDNSIDGYPEDERDGRSDMQMVADECSYILSCFEEDGHVLCEDLEEAKECIRETRNGRMPMIVFQDGSIKPKWRKDRINTAKDCINEYRRLQNLMKRLNDKGFYGRW